MKAETLQQVAEVQGLYGPFTFPEVLLQQIWRRGEFQQTAIRTTEGKVLDVLHPGRWNRLGGPDFRSARLRLQGKRRPVHRWDNGRTGKALKMQSAQPEQVKISTARTQ